MIVDDPGASTDYVPRYVDAYLTDLLTELPALLLTGPRGCGKTTTARRHALSALRLDVPEQATAFRAAPDEVLGTFPAPTLVDEWQAVPESMGAIKRAVDARPGAGRFVITGSVRSRLGPEGWPGTGRVVPLPMYPLTVGELQRTAGAEHFVTRLFASSEPATARIDGEADVLAVLDHALRGGFPDAIGLSAAARSRWYEGYLDQLIRHDVTDAADVRSPAGLARLLHGVALSTAGQPDLVTLARAADLDHRTARSYLDLLEDLRIIERVPAWTTNRLSRMVKLPKYYMIDTAMAAHLAGDTRESLVRDGDRLGRLVDTFVAAQLRPLLHLASPTIKAHHLRDANNTREVDLVLESASGTIVALEIKAASSVSLRDARHLIWLRDRLGDTFHRGLIMHTGSTTYPVADRIWAMPIASMWSE